LGAPKNFSENNIFLYGFFPQVFRLIADQINEEHENDPPLSGMLSLTSRHTVFFWPETHI
jgi:hypothetical protein